METVAQGLRLEKAHIYHFSLKYVSEVKTYGVDSSSGKYPCPEWHLSLCIDSHSDDLCLVPILKVPISSCLCRVSVRMSLHPLQT